MAINGERTIQEKYKILSSVLNERSRRLWIASEAIAYGRGGIAVLCRATGVSNKTVHKGIHEINEGQNKSHPQDIIHIRRKGGGRKKLTQKNNGLLIRHLDEIIEPATRGDPESPLRWTSKSLRKLANELNRKNHYVSYRTIGRLLQEQGYSLQANRKTHEGCKEQDRDQQFEYIYKKVTIFLKRQQPVISVDTKKKELVGNFKNNGKEWRKKHNPLEVEAYDFLSKASGKIVPYGIYDLAKNKGWVSVGISKDTAEFAVNTIRMWWEQMGQGIYKKGAELLITADCGGSNGNRVRLWKRELQKLADEMKMVIHVCHFPPGTSKWNKVEHRLFSYISKNWRGKPLVNIETVLNLIRNTKTQKGLKVMAVLDENIYQKGIEVNDEEMKSIHMQCDKFHPEWNYKIKPRTS